MKTGNIQSTIKDALDEIHKGKFEEIAEVDEEHYSTSEVASRKSFENRTQEDDLAESGEEQSGACESEQEETARRDSSPSKGAGDGIEGPESPSLNSLPISRKRISTEQVDEPKSRKLSRDLMSSLSQNPGEIAQMKELEEEIDIVVGNSELDDDKIFILSKNETEAKESSQLTESLRIENIQMQSNKFFPKLSEELRAKVRSKSENIRKEKNEILNIEIKEGDFGSDLHKSFHSISQKKTFEKVESLEKKVCPHKEAPNKTSCELKDNPPVIFLRSNEYRAPNKKLPDLQSNEKTPGQMIPKRVQSHSTSPNPKRKKNRKWFRKHKKHFSTFSTVSPLKKMMQTYKKKRFSGKSQEKEVKVNLTGNNYFRQKTESQKRDKIGRNTFSNIVKSTKYRQWSPISQKLLNMRKKILRKK